MLIMTNVIFLLILKNHRLKHNTELEFTIYTIKHTT